MVNRSRAISRRKLLRVGGVSTLGSPRLFRCYGGVVQDWQIRRPCIGRAAEWPSWPATLDDVVLRASSLTPNAPKVLEGSYEDVTIGDRQRGVRRFSTAELVDGQQLELWIGREDHSFTTAHQDIKAPLGVDHRTPGQ